MYADKTAWGWTRFVDRIRKLWNVAPQNKPARVIGAPRFVMGEAAVKTPREVSSR